MREALTFRASAAEAGVDLPPYGTTEGVPSRKSAVVCDGMYHDRYVLEQTCRSPVRVGNSKFCWFRIACYAMGASLRCGFQERHAEQDPADDLLRGERKQCARRAEVKDSRNPRVVRARDAPHECNRNAEVRA